MSVIHLAGCFIRISNRAIQRCMICGEILINNDLSRMMVPEGQSSEPARWRTGDLVRQINGEHSTGWVKVGELPEDFSLEDIPKDFCLELVEN